MISFFFYILHRSMDERELASYRKRRRKAIYESKMKIQSKHMKFIIKKFEKNANVDHV